MTGRKTHITFGLLLFWITVAIVNIIIAETVENNDGMFVLKIRQNKIQEVFWSLREYNFTHLYQVTGIFFSYLYLMFRLFDCGSSVL